MDDKRLKEKNSYLQQLKTSMPEVFVEGKIDWNKLKAALGEAIDSDSERYALHWVGKSEAIKKIDTSLTKTLIPNKEESVNFDTTQNIFIEGDNLEVLQLLQQHYLEKIQMIYIDPPYNTGNNSFVYQDNFSEIRASKKELGGKKNAKFSKNSIDKGHSHSNWMTMMYPRLILAKNLLKQDGTFFISIDDNEVHNLKLLMDEIFGEQNFIANVVRRRRKSQANLAHNISTIHEYVLIYSKSKESLLNRITGQINESNYKNLDHDPRGPYVTMPCTNRGGSQYAITTPTGVIITDEWRFKPETYNRLEADNRLVFPREGNGKPRYKLFLADKKKKGVIPNSWWDTISSNQEATRELKKLFDGKKYFDFPKPVDLLKRIITLGSNEDSIILDFFAGASTTAEAVMRVNLSKASKRKFIMVQLPEKLAKKSEAYKDGYRSIADISRERIRRAAKQIGTELQNKNIKTGEQQEIDLGFKVFKTV